MAYRFQDLLDTNAADWQAYTRHEFVRQLGRGTLPADCFRHYLKQDYLFLVNFARAYALAIYKSRNFAEIGHALTGLKALVEVESRMHVAYCADWGISEAELATLPEARANLAYTRYVLDTGLRGDLLDMHVALAPCFIGYIEIARFLAAWLETRRGAQNPYERWLALYLNPDFQQAADHETAWLDARLARVDAQRFTELAATFRDATRLEIGFWDMGLTLAD